MSEHEDSALIGYARVSTGEQELALQLDALNNVCAKRIYPDVGSVAALKTAAV